MNMPTLGSTISDRITKNEKLSSEELQAFMDRNGISDKEMAEILGVSAQAVKLWLSGARDFSITNSRLIRQWTKYPQLIKEF